MSTQRIPPESWPSFFTAFTRQHHGWLVTVDTGVDRVAEAQPLDEVHAEGRNIELRAGSARYRLPNASAVTVTTAPNDETAIDHLEIESGSERLTLRFREVIRPELVDGIVP
jgi:hypothetical protein